MPLPLTPAIVTPLLGAGGGGSAAPPPPTRRWRLQRARLIAYATNAVAALVALALLAGLAVGVSRR